VFLVNVEHERMMSMSGGYCGLSFGNIIIMSDETTNFYPEAMLLTHERAHSDQWRALGLAMLLDGVRTFLDIEGQDNNPYDVGVPGLAYQNKTMWTPPTWWPFQWSFITIEIPRR